MAEPFRRSLTILTLVLTAAPLHVSNTIFHDEAILRLMLEGLGITTNLPGASAFAPNMNEFFR